jgi:1-acyl-sn-glycerol-3-phosphate acyltransferase
MRLPGGIEDFRLSVHRRRPVSKLRGDYAFALRQTPDAGDTGLPRPIAMLQPVIDLQQPVRWAMTGYVRSAFRVRSFGLEQLQFEPATILAPNHRSDNDVPLLVSTLGPRWTEMVTAGLPWPTFAADDHAFLRGFLAGYPEGLPLTVRRLLWPIRVGGILERHLQCVPVRQPAQMRLVELLRSAPDGPLDGRLPPDLDAALRSRADELRLSPPVRAADVLEGRFADLLWTLVDRDRTSPCEEIWRSHLRAAVGDFRRLAAALRSGGLVVIFPEGELPPEGQVGPLRPGLPSLVRRGRARLVQPVAISYDPLAPGRVRAYISVAAPVVTSPAPDPPAGAAPPASLDDRVTDAMRRAIPLTARQIAAAVLRDGGSSRSLQRTGAEWVARAKADARPIEPDLLGGRRRPVLAPAFARARRRGGADGLITALAPELQNANAVP